MNKFARTCEWVSTALHVLTLLLIIRAVKHDPPPPAKQNLIPYTFDKDLWGTKN